MRKILAILAGILLVLSAAAAEEAPASLLSFTGLDAVQEKLEQGAVFEKVYYTDGYGFSTSEFTTANPEEMRQLWDALGAVTVAGKTDESVTDWYPQIVFYLSDGTSAGAGFEAHWLCSGRDNYALRDDGAFWSLTAALTEKYGGALRPQKPVREDGAVPDGWYRIGVDDAGHIDEGWIGLSLYEEDLYDRAAVEGLRSGDAVIVQDAAYTVELIVIHGRYDSDGDGEWDMSCVLIDGLDDSRELQDRHEIVVDGDLSDAPENFVPTAYELITAEDFDGYIVFEPVSDTACRAVVNDWSPCGRLGGVTVQLPLPDSFVYLDYIDEEGDAQAFLDDVSEEWYTPYNTSALFENGALVRVSHSDYPFGPEDE